MAGTTSRVEIVTGPRGPVVHADGRPLTGPDPSASIRRRLPVPTEIAPQTLVILCSPLHGDAVNEWLARVPETCAVLAVELDDDLDRVTRPWHPPASSRRFVYATGTSAAVAAGERLIRTTGLRRVSTVYLSGGARLHRDGYLRLEEQLMDSAMRFWQNRGTEIRLLRRWMSNVVRNATLAGLPVDALRGRVPRRAVLVGAGPSLEDHLGELHRLFPAHGRRQRADVSLVALDTALPTLAAAGVTPDMVVAMDGQLANAADLLPWRWENTAFLLDATVHFSVPRRVRADRRFWFVSRFSENALFRDPELAELLAGFPVLPPRGSVAPAALHLLTERLGVRAVFCVGIDFWYRPPKTHARMSPGDRAVRRCTSRLTHRDGHDRVLARPWRTVTLRDGSVRPGDAVLADQARLVRQSVERLPGSFFHAAGAAGLTIGSDAFPGDTPVTRWLELESSAPVAGDAPPAPGRDPDDDTAAARRLATLRALVLRLTDQESRLADPAAAAYLDAGLDCAVMDLPQWPLMTLRRDWIELHRPRILRAVRDLRRRAERALYCAEE